MNIDFFVIEIPNLTPNKTQLCKLGILISQVQISLTQLGNLPILPVVFTGNLSSTWTCIYPFLFNQLSDGIEWTLKRNYGIQHVTHILDDFFITEHSKFSQRL